MSAYETWRKGLPSERDFWADVIRTGGRWPEDWKARLDPGAELQPHLQALLRSSPAWGTPMEKAYLLDVGAGPATILGKVWRGGPALDITAIDVLADAYNELLAEAGVAPPVRTEPGRAETLLSRFLPGMFDLVYARNALDHAYDPHGAIRAMLQLAAKGAPVRLEHVSRVATKEGRAGLHQWDFYEEGGDFWIDRLNLSAELRKEGVDVEAKTEGGKDSGWCMVTMRRRA